MFQESGGYMYTQTALDFKLNVDVVARKDTFQKSLLNNKRTMTTTHPRFTKQFVTKMAMHPTL